MELKFNLKNKELVDNLLLNVNGQTYCLSDEEKTAKIKLQSEEEIKVTAIYQYGEDKETVKNPVFRVLLGIVGIVIYFIVGLIMLFDGERLRPKGFFERTNPFRLEKSFIIKSSKNPINVVVKDSKFNTENIEMQEPDITFEGAQISESGKAVYFRKTYTEKDFKRNLLLTYAVLYVLIFALNVFGIALIIRSMLCNMDLLTIIGLILIELLFAAMIAIPIYLSIRVKKHYKILYSKLLKKYDCI